MKRQENNKKQLDVDDEDYQRDDGDDYTYAVDIRSDNDELIDSFFLSNHNLFVNKTLV